MKFITKRVIAFLKWASPIKITDIETDQDVKIATSIRKGFRDSSWIWVAVPVLFFILLNFYGDRNHTPFLLTYVMVLLILGKTIIKDIAVGIDEIEKTNLRRLEKLTEVQRGKEYLFSILRSVLTPMAIAFIGLNFSISLLVPITCNAFELLNLEIIPKKICKNKTDILSQFFTENSGGTRFH
ncbi:hypothetical protein KBD34_05315 [Patescibacteria group bacterium]|nr:hypothetical protein [Patescibacteria group bacterium]